MALRFTIPASALLVACTGGPGSGSAGYQATQDPVAASQDGVGSTTESSADSNEGVSPTTESGGAQGSGGAGRLDCSGTYSCVITAAGKTQTVRLPFASGCTAEKASFDADGTVRDEDGATVGTYRVTPGGFTVSGSTTVDKTLVPFTYECTKVSDTAEKNDDSDDDDDNPKK